MYKSKISIGDKINLKACLKANYIELYNTKQENLRILEENKILRERYFNLRDAFSLCSWKSVNSVLYGKSKCTKKEIKEDI